MGSSWISTRKLHFFSGLTLTVFIAIHLFNQAAAVAGPERHIQIMNAARTIYRNPLIETVLMGAVLVQIISGIRLIGKRSKAFAFSFEVVQLYSGMYLAFFLVAHVFAVMMGRSLNIDTNYYFAAAGLNFFPFVLFYVPYYTLAIISVFGHIAAVHHKNMRHRLLGCSVRLQSRLILVLGAIFALFVIYAMTGRFHGILLPEAYRFLIGG